MIDKQKQIRITDPQQERMGGNARSQRGYACAVVAGTNASLAAISAKAASASVDWGWKLLCYTGVVLFNITMWACYVKSLTVLTSLQATVVNFATNFLLSGLAGFFFFKEFLHMQWFLGAFLIVMGTLILSRSSCASPRSQTKNK